MKNVVYQYRTDQWRHKGILQKCIKDKDCNSEHCIEIYNQYDTNCRGGMKVNMIRWFRSIDPDGKPSPLRSLKRPLLTVQKYGLGKTKQRKI